ncbi:3-hydroxybutyryl-CoA dehydrogenase [Pontibacterium granulatum]|uniref:3-hydroxybutyryl-CoA dehydrogenase n=1 Tax=Pontibacterium granulatum TaxID=2036029 RepID=UPI00249B5672|nr:3-hydroxybutyryl-CoA dehydrogenase [Pontibacterium granulatum]MDI3323952.1 3-hydroxybutyryl-CoA dehydrogenase [Pontibacterium granulatum]
MTISTIGVIGAGQMGLGIAQSFATAGLKVILNDINEAALERGLDTILNSLERLNSKGKLQESSDAIISRITTATELTAMADAQLVVEAVIEDEVLKQQILSELDWICPPNTILASNTSSISITRLATVTKRPDRVIGMHFMNPVPMMKLVEVITCLHTSTETYNSVIEMVNALEKVPVSAKDRPGFVVNRILIPMINEAVFTLDEGVASASEIDSAMQLGAAHPMGPLALADLIGLDTCLSIMQVLYEGYNDSKYRPCPLLKEMVDSGLLGRKSGRGFFDYS